MLFRSTVVPRVASAAGSEAGACRVFADADAADGDRGGAVGGSVVGGSVVGSVRVAGPAQGMAKLLAAGAFGGFVLRREATRLKCFDQPLQCKALVKSGRSDAEH